MIGVSPRCHQATVGEDAEEAVIGGKTFELPRPHRSGPSCTQRRCHSARMSSVMPAATTVRLARMWAARRATLCRTHALPIARMSR